MNWSCQRFPKVQSNQKSDHIFYVTICYDHTRWKMVLFILLFKMLWLCFFAFSTVRTPPPLPPMMNLLFGFEYVWRNRLRPNENLLLDAGQCLGLSLLCRTKPDKIFQHFETTIAVNIMKIKAMYYGAFFSLFFLSCVDVIMEQSFSPTMIENHFSLVFLLMCESWRISCINLFEILELITTKP